MTGELKPYPAYKDSSVEWLGDVPEHWEIRRAKWLFRKEERPIRSEDEVITCFRDGVVTLRSNRRTRGFTESIKEIGYQGIRRGDLVVHAMDAFAGAIGVSDSDGKGSPVYAVCSSGSNADNHYYAHAIREMARSKWILALSKGIRERSTDFRYSTLAAERVPLPPSSEQTAIVRYLDYMDRRIRRYIRAKQKLIKLLEEQKQALIHQAVTGQIDVRTGEPYPEYKDSGVEWLGKVPKHWGVMSVGTITTLVQTGPFGSQLHSYEYIVGGIPMINPSHMVSGRIVPDEAVTVTAEKLTDLSRHRVRVGDIIAARRGELGRCVLVTPVEEGWLCGTGSMLIRCDHSLLDPAYFQIAFSSQSIRDALQLSSVGATMDNLNAGMVSRLRIQIPPVSEQQAIVGFYEKERKSQGLVVSRLHREIELIQEYRTRLIADVVTGKVDVRVAAAALPDEDDSDQEEDELIDAEDGLDEELEAVVEGLGSE